MVLVVYSSHSLYAWTDIDVVTFGRICFRNKLVPRGSSRCALPWLNPENRGHKIRISLFAPGTCTWGDPPSVSEESEHRICCCTVSNRIYTFVNEPTKFEGTKFYINKFLKHGGAGPYLGPIDKIDKGYL